MILINPFKKTIWGVHLRLPNSIMEMVVKAIGISGAIEEALDYYKTVCLGEEIPVVSAVINYATNEKVWWIKE